MKKELIWVFGYSCVGKKTLMYRTATGGDRRLIELAQMKKPIVMPFLCNDPVFENGAKRLLRLDTVFRQFTDNDYTKELADNLYLVHGQGADLGVKSGTISYLYKAYPEAFNIAVWCETTFERLKRNSKKREMPFDEKIFEQYEKDKIHYTETLEKYFKEIITIKL